MTDLPPIEISVVPETPAEIELAIVKIVDPDGFLVASNNLSDVDDPEEARQNLGIVGGVKPDWNATPGDSSEILNQPVLGTAAAANVEDFATAAQGLLADTALQSEDIGVTVQGYNANTVIDPDYNTFTDSEKTKLEGIESGAQVNPDLSGYVTDGELTTALASYQPLATVLTNTTASFTIAQETKLAGIAGGAEVNVNADWNAVSGDAQILNKPTLGTAAATNSTDYATAAQGTLANTALQSEDIGVTVQGYNADTVIDPDYNTFTDAEKTKLANIGAQKETIILALTAPGTNIALGKILAINAFPYAMTITSVRADVGTAPTGANLIVDMLKNGVSMMTNKFTIEATETSSTTATVLPSLSSNSLAIGDKLSFNVDQIGATVPGQYLTVTIEGERG